MTAYIVRYKVGNEAFAKAVPIEADNAAIGLLVRTALREAEKANQAQITVERGDTEGGRGTVKGTA